MDTFGDFNKPSELRGGGRFPKMEQLKGRLCVFEATAAEHDVTTELNKTPHTRLTCNVTFLDGPAIATVIDKDGDVVHTFDTPIACGDVMEGMFVSAAWFTSRLAKTAGTGVRVLGRVVKLPARKAGGFKPWGLSDPLAGDLDRGQKWLKAQQEKALAEEEGTVDPFGD